MRTDVLARLSVDCRRPLSAELVAEINTFVDRVLDDGAIAVVALTGAPAGGTAYDGAGVQLVNKWEQALRRLDRVETVTIAVVEGVCAGVALDVLLATDYRIGTKDLLLTPPVGGAGGWPGMAIHRLVNQVGLGRARRSVLFGTSIAAPEALSMSLIDDMVVDTESAVTEVAASLAGLSAKELSMRRQLMGDASSTSFEDALGAHLAACDRMLRLASAAPAKDA